MNQETSFLIRRRRYRLAVEQHNLRVSKTGGRRYMLAPDTGQTWMVYAAIGAATWLVVTSLLRQKR